MTTTLALAELTAHDRCDRCGAQAYVKVQFTPATATELLFCGHHFADHEQALEEQAYLISDQRGKLTG